MSLLASAPNNLELTIVGQQEILIAQVRRLGFSPRLATPEALGEHTELPASRQLIILAAQHVDDTASMTRATRFRQKEAGIIVATKGLTLDMEVALLEAGADRCLPLPCDFRLIQASVNAMIRRLLSDWSPHEDGVHLSSEGRVLRIGSNVFELRNAEYRLCEYLILNRGRWVSERELLRNVLGVRHDRETSLVRVHIRHIRKALRELRDCVASKRGKGYQFCLPESPALAPAPVRPELGADSSCG